MAFTRNCPNCNKIITHKTKESLSVCKKSGTFCMKCAFEKRSKKLVEKGLQFNPRIDLTGKTINCWHVINLHFHGKTSTNNRIFYYWNTKCIYCGIESVKETSHINKTKMCRFCHNRSKGQTGLNGLYTRYKKTAFDLGREFNLNLEEFKTLTSSNCYFCGQVPNQICGSRNKNKISTWGDYLYNGVDRMDNSKGYFLTNCVSCCDICNWAKHSRTEEEFKDYIKNIGENYKENKIPFLQPKKYRYISTNTIEGVDDFKMLESQSFDYTGRLIEVKNLQTD